MARFNIDNKGQSLIEIIIAMAIGGLLIGSATAAITLTLKSRLDTKTIQIANLLSSEYINNLLSFGGSDWISLYNPPAAKGPDSQFYLNASGTIYAALSGTTSTVVEGKTFTRYFSIENVNRDLCGINDITTNATTSCASVGDSGIAEDPSTQKITIKLSWTGGGNLTKIVYLTRNKNVIFNQDDWGGGANQENFPISSSTTIINNKFSTSTGNVNFSTPGEIKISL